MVEGKSGTERDVETTQVVFGNNRFALELYEALREGKGNRLFSPYSIFVALAMTYAGAREETATQLARALHLPPEQQTLHPALATLQRVLEGAEREDELLLLIANSLWPHAKHPLLQEYLSLIQSYYSTAITPVDYTHPERARERINAWVAQQTSGRIEQIIPPKALNTLTRLVLVNAIYFKGAWAVPFNETLTRDRPFWISPNERVSVPLMAQQGRFGYAEEPTLQILELPYAGEALSMVVLLPKRRDGLPKLEASLSLPQLTRWLGRLRNREVGLLLPKFETVSDLLLNHPLTALGMGIAFDDERANFAGMDGRPDWLYLKAVFHKGFLEVNEKGTEAAAASAALVVARSGFVRPRPQIHVDHPFLLLIRDRLTGLILFLGRVVDPRM
jgi:serpin B